MRKQTKTEEAELGAAHPALGRQREENLCEFEAIPAHLASSKDYVDLVTPKQKRGMKLFSSELPCALFSYMELLSGREFCLSSVYYRGLKR